jgi:hypothetical protein
MQSLDVAGERGDERVGRLSRGWLLTHAGHDVQSASSRKAPNAARIKRGCAATHLFRPAVGGSPDGRPSSPTRPTDGRLSCPIPLTPKPGPDGALSAAIAMWRLFGSGELVITGDPIARRRARQAATWQRIEQVLRSALERGSSGSPQAEHTRAATRAMP